MKHGAPRDCLALVGYINQNKVIQKVKLEPQYTKSLIQADNEACSAPELWVSENSLTDLKTDSRRVVAQFRVPLPRDGSGSVSDLISTLLQQGVPSA